MNVSRRVVVDASVVVKWLVDEEHSTEALAVGVHYVDLLAPDLLIPELGSVFSRKVRQGTMLEDIAREAPMRVMDRVSLLPSGPLTSIAFDLAIKHQRSFFDALYVALAMYESCRFVTADLKLYNGLKHALPETMLWIGDVPQVVSDAR